MKGRVLVVDDDSGVGTVLSALLRQGGYAAEAVLSGAEALAALQKNNFNVVVTDQRMPKMDGLTLLAAIRERWPGLPVVMLTAHGTIPLAVEAMRAGAYDFVVKPFERDEILYTIGKAVATGRHCAAQVEGDADAVGTEDYRAVLEKVAGARSTVLLLGETGTGKSVAARAIHDAGHRRDAPFVHVHCGALPESLLESELFGYVAGAFTGATKDKPGRVEIAEGGTLFLDEVAEISPAVQVKLLRLLQERTYEPLGSTTSRTADVRFIAATNRDLAAMRADGRFRDDLYHRLSVVPIAIPPLRDRPADIPVLARRFCREQAEANGRGTMTLDDGAIAHLCTQGWPGNVRGLQNFVERLVVLCDGPTITAGDVLRELKRQGEVVEGSSSTNLDDRRKAVERAALLEALERSQNNRSRAARLLGVSRRTLYNKLHEHDLV